MARTTKSHYCAECGIYKGDAPNRGYCQYCYRTLTGEAEADAELLFPGDAISGANEFPELDASFHNHEIYIFPFEKLNAKNNSTLGAV